jgi:hypothetical protein
MLDALEHIMIAHRDIYASFNANYKKMSGGNKVRIGLGISADPLFAWNTINPAHIIKTEKLTKAIQQSVYTLLTRCRMEIDVHGTTKDNYIHSIDSAYDFLLLNYAGPRYVQGSYEIRTATISYPEGLYFAVKTAGERLNKKIPLLKSYPHRKRRRISPNHRPSTPSLCT